MSVFVYISPVLQMLCVSFSPCLCIFHVHVGRKVAVAGGEEEASLWPHTQAPSQLLTLTWS